VFQVRPQITENQKVVFTQTAPIAELAVVTKEEQVSLEFDTSFQVFSQTIPLTEKKLTAQAVYRIKAGFDLREPFSVEIDPKTHAIHAKLPAAKILSVEQVGDLSLAGEDAWLDKVNDADRAQILDALQKTARSQAGNSGLKADAQTQAQDRLEKILRHNGENVELEWTNPTTKTML
jgi:hypothetical protein